MKKVIVFGATGTIGMYTSLALKEKGYDVIAIGRRSSDNGFFTMHGIQYFSVDVSKENDFNKLPSSGVDVVVHLAGVMPAAMEGYHPEVFIDSVMHGTLNVLRYCVRCQIDRIIFSHSRADSNYLMGKSPISSDIVKKFPLTGDHSVYSICKNAAVDLTEHFYHEYGIKRFVLRLPTIYAYHPNPYFYVNGIKKPMAYRYIIDQAIVGNKIEIWGDPTKAKEIVYVDDCIQVIQKCINSSIDGGVFNVGRGVAVSLEEQIKGIVDVFSTKKRSEIIYRPDMPNAREYVNDISKTTELLDYHPEFDYIKLLQAYKQEMELERFKVIWGTKQDY